MASPNELNSNFEDGLRRSPTPGWRHAAKILEETREFSDDGIIYGIDYVSNLLAHVVPTENTVMNEGEQDDQ